MSGEVIEIEPGSPLNVPLIRHMFEDPHVDFFVRAIDARWHYGNYGVHNLAGFNPVSGLIFVASNSALMKWLENPQASARAYNYRDRLIGEVLFAAHDYLHIWAYQWIAERLPAMGLGEKPVTHDNFEDLAFCHLLTEAVATVGLDYWYLCRVPLNDTLDIGTAMSGLTVSFNERWTSEYRRFRPELNVQSEAFFREKCEFYCSGVFEGFEMADLRQSPLLYDWLTHELGYGAMQRMYSRLWLLDFVREPNELTEDELKAPFDTSASWKQELIRDLGELLWKKVHGEELLAAPRRIEIHEPWRHASERKTKIDFRFSNYNTRRGAVAPESIHPDSFTYLFEQYVGQFDFGAFDKDLIPVFDHVRDHKNFALADRLLEGQPRLPVDDEEPDELFLPN